MQRMVQNEKPLENIVQLGDILIIEKEEAGRVVDRQGGFYYAHGNGHLVLTDFDPTIEPSTLREHGMSPERYRIPEFDDCPRLEDITHYFLIPHSEIR